MQEQYPYIQEERKGLYLSWIRMKGTHTKNIKDKLYHLDLTIWWWSLLEQTGEWHAANWIFELFMLKYIWRFSSKVNELNFQMFLWPYDFIILTELLIIKKQFDGFDASYFPRHKSRSTQGKGTVKLIKKCITFEKYKYDRLIQSFA